MIPGEYSNTDEFDTFLAGDLLIGIDGGVTIFLELSELGINGVSCGQNNFSKI